MKIHFYLASFIALSMAVPAVGQPTPPRAPRPAPGLPSRPGASVETVPKTGLPVSEKPALTRFDLNFSGGTPKGLVAAIEKAMGKPLNVIIPEEDSNVQLPPLKMNNVDVAQLFQALQNASLKFERFSPPLAGTYSTAYGFKTDGRPTDDSIWYFFVQKPAPPPGAPVFPPPPKICRFYSLAPYLDRGYTVDDITTAIETGWKMLGDTARPKISFHKETKLLIAVGEPDKLEIINAALKALETPRPKSVIDPATGLPVSPAEKLKGKD